MNMGKEIPSVLRQLSKVLYCGESLNQLNGRSQTVFDCGLWLTFPKHNTDFEIRKPVSMENLHS